MIAKKKRSKVELFVAPLVFRGQAKKKKPDDDKGLFFGYLRAAKSSENGRRIRERCQSLKECEL